MKIDKKLNLVIPLERDTGTIYAFSTPIRREIFEANFRVISQAFAQLWAGGLGMHAGPRVAALVIRGVAEDMGIWAGVEGVEATLVAEFRRLTNVLMPVDGNWVHIPYEDAIRRDLLTDDEFSEVEGAIAFFMVNSAMHKKVPGEQINRAAAGMWGLEVTLSSISEYRASLMPPTVAATSGETAKLSSIPS